MKIPKIPKISHFFKNLNFFAIFFRFRKKRFFFRNKIFKIQNLSRNPKITLRKSCEHFKIVKSKKVQVFLQVFPDFRMVLGILVTTLNPYRGRGHYREVSKKNTPLAKTPAPTLLRFLEIIKLENTLSKLKMWRKSKARRRRKFLGIF